MKKISKPIVFFGSGPVAAASLSLLKQHFQIESIVTKPTTVDEMAAAAPGIHVYPVAGKQELNELMSKKLFQSPLGILIDFGIIVGQSVIDYFAFGIINAHFSLLPQWRGADPITFAVLSGQKKTGVSLMLLTAGMDEGPLLGQAVYELADDITTPKLTAGLIDLSEALLVDTVPRYLAGEISPAPQELASLTDSKTPTYSRKLAKEDGRINWDKSAVELEREVRAFQPWPTSYTSLNGVELQILAAKTVSKQGVPGSLEIANNKLLIYCGKDALSIDRLKPAGKNEMDVGAFLNGYRQKLVS